MTWHNLGSVNALTEHVVHARRVGETDIALARLQHEVFAFHNRCPHMDFPLDGSRIVDNELECSWHRATFDVRTGAVLNAPRACASLQLLPTRIDDETLWIQL